MYNHLIAVTKRSLCPDGLPAQLERVCAVSPRAVLLREKDLSSTEYRALAQQAQEICTRFDVPLILHSFPQVAQELGISRLHVPLPMLHMLEQREQWEVLGTSCHSMEQMLEAVSLGATYITLGNTKIALPESKGRKPEVMAYIGKTVKAGIRPESLHDEEVFINQFPNALADAKVDVVELMGAETYLYLTCEGLPMIARVSPRAHTQPGDQIKIACDANKIHLFDADTEQTITN